ncbi:MAG: hypothetical protein JJU05_08455 [Verrucomicrobia bacterium]|nr:hypothetical protein [Verrucomicrobiota bacterium]MCH8526680.1 hypothetical protein [Kiritimatiellia bacterium]
MNAKKIIYVVLGLLAVVALSRWLGGPSEDTIPVVDRGVDRGVDRDVERLPSFESAQGEVDPEDAGRETTPGRAPGEATERDTPERALTERTEREPRGRPAVPGLSALPAQAGTLRSWLAQGEPEGSKDREIWVARGLALARERQPRMREWIQSDPERALEEALTPRMFAALPEAVQALVERPVAEEGFYGVMAICNHGPDEEHIGSCEIRHEVVLGFGTFDAEAFQANIYGAREQKMTVEQDSIYGVVMDGQIALHEHDVVIVDDGEGAEGGRFAVYYRGEVRYADTRADAERIRDTFQ